MELFTPGHLIVLAVVVAILFFGWKQLPDMSRSLGRSLRIFKTEIKGLSQDDKDRADHADQAGTAEAPKAIDPPRAQVVNNDARVVSNDNVRREPAPAQPAAGRPRPGPRPRA